ncbi:MAG: alpha/beta hydrolase [Dehalococcoidia bacterium]
MGTASTVHYATTLDGVKIAYGVMGAGEPLLYARCPAGLPFTEVVPTPELDSWFGKLARHFRLITFDFRGGGLSERGDRELTFDTLALDMLAVLDDLGLASAHVQTELMSSAAALHLASKHPDRVRRLVMWHPMVRALAAQR